jgi:hypothetical protein
LKHLKYINELRVSTYRNAARGLRKFGHDNRADKLEYYSDEVEEVRTHENLIKQREIYSKYGEVTVNIDGEVFRGYLKLIPMVGFFTDFYSEFRDSDTEEIEFFVETWFIPHEDEDVKSSLMDSHNLEEVMHDGLLPLKNFTFIITKDAEVAKVSSTSMNNNFLWEDDRIPINRIPINFTNRRSAMLYKKALKSIFSGDSYYPVNVYNRTEDGGNHWENKDGYDHINQTIFNNTGFRNDFGLTIDKLAEAVQNYSINKLYESN